jgi:cytochrome oxidase Cu insertion factor (SCO1/SenC/PrrC family)
MKIALALLIALTLGLTPTVPAAADKVLEDLLFDLQLVPLGGQVPAAFELERLSDGKKITLAEHRGRPVMLYFWATW